VIAAILQQLSAALVQPMAEALDAARQQPMNYMDETGAPTGSADCGNPTGQRSWQWVMVTIEMMVFGKGLSCPTGAVIELLGNDFSVLS
jgi:transposase